MRNIFILTYAISFFGLLIIVPILQNTLCNKLEKEGIRSEYSIVQKTNKSELFLFFLIPVLNLLVTMIFVPHMIKSIKKENILKEKKEFLERRVKLFKKYSSELKFNEKLISLLTISYDEQPLVERSFIELTDLIYKYDNKVSNFFSDDYDINIFTEENNLKEAIMTFINYCYKTVKVVNSDDLDVIGFKDFIKTYSIEKKKTVIDNDLSLINLSKE